MRIEYSFHVKSFLKYTVRNFYRNFSKLVTGFLFSYNFVKLRYNFIKFSYFLVNLRNNFLIFSRKVLNIPILVSGNILKLATGKILRF